MAVTGTCARLRAWSELYPDPSAPAGKNAAARANEDERLAKFAGLDVLDRDHVICGSLLTDLALGGLNYQIEHHLFPSMPRPNLRHAQAPVRAFCAQRGIPYSQTGLLDFYTQVLRHLHTTGRAPGPEPTADTATAGPDGTLEPGHAEDSLRPAPQAGAYW